MDLVAVAAAVVAEKVATTRTGRSESAERQTERRSTCTQLLQKLVPLSAEEEEAKANEGKGKKK